MIESNIKDFKQHLQALFNILDTVQVQGYQNASKIAQCSEIMKALAQKTELLFEQDKKEKEDTEVDGQLP